MSTAFQRPCILEIYTQLRVGMTGPDAHLQGVRHLKKKCKYCWCGKATVLLLFFFFFFYPQNVRLENHSLFIGKYVSCFQKHCT